MSALFNLAKSFFRLGGKVALERHDTEKIRSEGPDIDRHWCRLVDGDHLSGRLFDRVKLAVIQIEHRQDVEEIACSSAPSRKILTNCVAEEAPSLQVATHPGQRSGTIDQRHASGDSTVSVSEELERAVGVSLSFGRIALPVGKKGTERLEVGCQDGVSVISTAARPSARDQVGDPFKVPASDAEVALRHQQ